MAALPARLTSIAASIRSPAATPLGVVIVSEVAEADVDELETVAKLGEAPRAGEDDAIATPAKSASATAVGQWARALQRFSAGRDVARVRLRNVVLSLFPFGSGAEAATPARFWACPPMRTDAPP